VDCIMAQCSAEVIDTIFLVKPQNAPADCNAVIARLEAAYPGIAKGLEQKRPFVGGAIQDGFDRAKSTHLLLLPGDLAVDLRCVPLLIEKEKQHPNGIVKISRWLSPDSFHNYPKSRKLFNGCAQFFLRGLYHTRLTDMTNPVQIMPAALYRSIRWKELNFPFLIEMVLCPLRLGVPIKEIPTVGFGRDGGKSNNSIWQTALYLKTALRIRFTKPEKLLKSKERSAL